MKRKHFVSSVATNGLPFTNYFLTEKRCKVSGLDQFDITHLLKASLYFAFNFLTILLLLSIQVFSQDKTIPGKVSTPYPTIINVAIEWEIEGDDNLNGIVTVQFLVPFTAHFDARGESVESARRELVESACRELVEPACRERAESASSHSSRQSIWPKELSRQPCKSGWTRKHWLRKKSGA